MAGPALGPGSGWTHVHFKETLCKYWDRDRYTGMRVPCIHLAHRIDQSWTHCAPLSSEYKTKHTRFSHDAEVFPIQCVMPHLHQYHRASDTFGFWIQEQ